MCPFRGSILKCIVFTKITGKAAITFTDIRQVALLSALASL